jgi:hypothetical protein
LVPQEAALAAMTQTQSSVTILKTVLARYAGVLQTHLAPEDDARRIDRALREMGRRVTPQSSQ